MWVLSKRINFLGFILLSFHAYAQSELTNWRELYGRNRFEQILAESELRKGDLEPDEVLLIADCHQKMGEFHTALTQYNLAERRGCTDEKLLLHRGICFMSLQDFESGVIDLTTYLRKNEGDPSAYYWLGELEYRRMENKFSLDYLDEALKLDSSYRDAYFLRGANYVELRRYQLAYEDFAEVFQLDPEMYRAKYYMAMCAVEMTQYETAIELLSELILEDTGFPADVFSLRAEAHYLQREYEDACADWDEAAQLGDDGAKENFKQVCTEKSGKPRFRKKGYFEF